MQLSEASRGAIQPVIREAFFGKQVRVTEKSFEFLPYKLVAPRVLPKLLYEELVVQIIYERVLRYFIRISGRFDLSLGFSCFRLSFQGFD